MPLTGPMRPRLPSLTPCLSGFHRISMADPIVQGATRQRYRGQRPLAGCNHEARARKMHTHLSDNGIATFDDDLMDGRGD